MSDSGVSPRSGRSSRCIAAQFNVAHTTVLRWKDRGAPCESDAMLRRWLRQAATDRARVTQNTLAAQVGRSPSQLTAWKKWGAPLKDVHALRIWAEQRGLLDRGRSQRSVACALGLNEGTLSRWKKLGAPTRDVAKLRNWMTLNNRYSKRSASRKHRRIPLYKIAQRAGITYGSLVRLKKEGAPVDVKELRAWLKERRKRRVTQRQIAKRIRVSADTVRRWARKGGPTSDLERLRLWRDGEIRIQAENRRKAMLRRQITRRLRARFRKALRCGGNKSAGLMTLVGCSQQALLDHIEANFCPGMSWVNRHLWHIDHVRPCASFDLKDTAQQRLCFHYSNLRPMWAADNMMKGARMEAKEGHE